MQVLAARPPSRSRRVICTMTIGLVTVAFAAQAGSAQTASGARGDSLFAAGEYAAARQEFNARLQRNAADATALYYLGRIALHQGESGVAVDWFEKAIRVDDGRADFHVWLGSALGDEAQRASKFRQPFLAKRVRTEFERAVALSPRHIEARYGLMQVYGVLPGVMGGSMEKAHQQATELANISPFHGYLGAGFLAQREKNFPAASQAYEKAIAVAPDSTASYLSLAALHQRQERWTEVFATYDRLLKRLPDDDGVHFYIGRAAAMSGQHLDRGEASLKRWLARPPRDARQVTVAGAHHRLGQIHAKNGRPDAARSEYEAALRINPKHSEARKALAALTTPR